MRKKVISSQAGMTLVEVVISIALLGMVGVAFLTALSTGIRAGAKVDERTTAINLARSQLENVKLQSYTEPPNYTTITPPDGYTITVSGTTLTTNVLQKITVTVSFAGVSVVALEGYKINLTP